MKGRIRSIKPGIVDDEITGALSDMAFRVFICMITFADDEGRLRANRSWLLSHIFWARDVPPRAFESSLVELEPLVEFYAVNGQSYARIRNWAKHQKVDRPYPSILPEPDTCSDDSTNVRRAFVSGEDRSGTGVGAGEEQDKDNLVPVSETNQTGLSALVMSDDVTEARKIDHRPDEVWDHYVATVKTYRPRRRPGNLKPKDRNTIKTLLAQGRTVDDLKRACSGLFKSLHHLGQNDRNTEYLEIEYALRKPDTFMALQDDAEPPRPKPPEPPPEGGYVDPAEIDRILAHIDQVFAS